ncbi:hypothetical protein ACVMB3_006274 [Sinorhizobium meliloti]
MCAHPRLGCREKCEGAQFLALVVTFAIEQACAANGRRWKFPKIPRVAAAPPKRIYASGVYQEVIMDVELLTRLGVAAFILAISVLVGQEVGLPTNVLETQATVTSNH